jgi:hypothetical protein
MLRSQTTLEKQTVNITVLAQSSIKRRAFVPEMLKIQAMLPVRWIDGDVVGWLFGICN